METNLFISKLDENISYDNLFEVTEIEEDDNEYESNLYKISIFGNFHHIAMGKKRTHKNNKLLAYFIAYLIHEEKVISKLGVFEKLYETEDELNEVDTNNINFENEKLHIHPKYYKMLKYLDEFSIEEEPEDEQEDEQEEGEEKVGELEEDEDELEEGNKSANEDGKNIVRIQDGEITLKRMDDNERYNIIKSFSKSDKSKFKIGNKEIDGKYAAKYIVNILKIFKIHLDNFKTDINNYKNSFNKIKQLFIKKEKGKAILYFKELINEAAESKEKQYIVNEFILALFEYILNIKFVILENGKINNFSLFETNFAKEISSVEKITKYEETIDLIKNYNPDCFYVVEKGEDGNYNFLEYNGSPHILFVEDNKYFMTFMKELYDKNDHEYIFDTQLTKFKNFVTNE